MKSKLKKLAKAKVRQKDYKKRHDIWVNNRPTVVGRHEPCHGLPKSKKHKGCKAK